jgi:hypothetical protein
MVFETYILEVVLGHETRGLIAISLQSVCPSVVGFFRPSSSYNLGHVGVGLFDGGSSPYGRCGP